MLQHVLAMHAVLPVKQSLPAIVNVGLQLEPFEALSAATGTLLFSDVLKSLLAQGVHHARHPHTSSF